MLIASLILELSGIYELVVLAKLGKTIALIVYMMRGLRSDEREEEQSHFTQYCCFGLLWTLLIAVLLIVVFLICDREREHVNLGTIPVGGSNNTTQS